MPIRAKSAFLAWAFLCFSRFAGGIFRVLAAAFARALGSTFLPDPLTGRSRMCPTLDFTT